VWRRYLEDLDIMLGIDSDTAVVNPSIKLEDWFPTSQDHVVLQQRSNSAVCAGTTKMMVGFAA
jgi:hypothetical protein